MTKVRFLDIDEGKKSIGMYKLVSTIEIDDVSELIKTFNFMMENDINLEVTSMADCDTDFIYIINSIAFVTPTFGKDMVPYLAVYVEEI